MKHICAGCKKTIVIGREVVQMMRGPWNGRMTPGFRELFAEWHWPRCFGHEFALGSQTRPYKCEECSKNVQLGEEISFIVMGEETGEGSTFSERRRKVLYSVKHYPRCPQSCR